MRVFATIVIRIGLVWNQMYIFDDALERFPPILRQLKASGQADTQAAERGMRALMSSVSRRMRGERRRDQAKDVRRACRSRSGAYRRARAVQPSSWRRKRATLRPASECL
eukprot:6213390-Pleurochrysis_carterae.AAC.6